MKKYSFAYLFLFCFVVFETILHGNKQNSKTKTKKKRKEKKRKNKEPCSMSKETSSRCALQQARCKGVSIMGRKRKKERVNFNQIPQEMDDCNHVTITIYLILINLYLY
jgi:hypothetical protein